MKTSVNIDRFTCDRCKIKATVEQDPVRFISPKGWIRLIQTPIGPFAPTWDLCGDCKRTFFEEAHSEQRGGA